jgi:Tfp pilus assembly PilM family ATPase
MAMVLSVEIDNSNIKFIEASKKSETLFISKCISIDISNGVKDEKIIDIKSVVNKISEALEKYGIKTKKAVFVINSNSIMVRTIKLPLLKKKSEILSMIQIELQQILSADLSKYQITYEICRTIKENKIIYADYIVYCIPRLAVNQCLELAENLKLKLLKIDIPHFCINTLYNNCKINNTLDINEITAFVNSKENSFSFYVANNGFCDFYFNSDFERNLIERVAEYQSLYMYSESYPSIDKTIEAQLIKIMRYYYSVSGNRKINKIFFYGIYNQEILTAIKNKLNIETEIINFMPDIETDEKLVDRFELNKYLHAVMALYSKNKNSILNTNINKKFINNYIYVAILVIIMAALFVSFDFVNSQAAMKNNIAAMSSFIDNDHNNQLNKKIEDIKSENDYLKGYLKQAEKLQEQIDINDFVDPYVLRKIYVAKPSATKVTSIYSDKDSTQLQCVSPSMSEVTLFFSNLREIEQIDSAYMPAIQSKAGQSFSYSLVLKLKDVSNSGS